jgi:hypothetical protein
MIVTQQDVEQFHRFATGKLANGGAGMTWQELFDAWMMEDPPTAEREAVNAIIRQGLQDIEAGRFRSAEEVNAELRNKFELPG